MRIHSATLDRLPYCYAAYLKTGAYRRLLTIVASVAAVRLVALPYQLRGMAHILF